MYIDGRYSIINLAFTYAEIMFSDFSIDFQQLFGPNRYVTKPVSENSAIAGIVPGIGNGI